jgi:TatD DNase family protein
MGLPADASGAYRPNPQATTKLAPRPSSLKGYSHTNFSIFNLQFSFCNKDSIMLVDSHAHLEMKDFDRDRDRVIARAQEAGVTQIVTVATTLPDFHKALKIAREHDGVHVALGIHPHEVKDIQPGDYEEMRRLARQEKKVVAFGEIGLDFYRNHSPREVQLSRFRELLRLGKELNLPIIIHDREAHEETLRILEEEKDGIWRGVFHCFSGDTAMARKVIQMGFSISIPGTVTFSKSRIQQEVVQKIPLEKVLLETDCPYLAPEPHRGLCPFHGGKGGFPERADPERRGPHHLGERPPSFWHRRRNSQGKNLLPHPEFLIFEFDQPLFESLHLLCEKCIIFS